MSFEVKNLEFNYFGEKNCIHSVSLVCEKGQTVVVYGQEGSGKSSLLMAMTGVNQKCSGDILIDGRKLEDIKPKDRNLSLIIECNSLFNHKSVYKNIRYPLKIRGVDKAEMNKKVEEMAELFELSGIYGKKAYMLTYEEFTRTVLARMFVREADYYFIDNPLNNLTGDKRKEIFYKYLPLFNKENSGFIYGTDDIDEVMALNKMTYILSYGYVIQNDIFANIIKQPINLTVVRLLKDRFFNTLNVNYSDTNIDGYDFSYKQKYFKIATDDDYKAVIAIPYNAVSIEDNADFEAEIIEIRCTGKGYLYNFKINKGFNLLGVSEKNFNLNQKVKIKVDFNQCLFYDKNTEFKAEDI